MADGKDYQGEFYLTDTIIVEEGCIGPPPPGHARAQADWARDCLEQPIFRTFCGLKTKRAGHQDTMSAQEILADPRLTCPECIAGVTNFRLRGY